MPRKRKHLHGRNGFEKRIAAYLQQHGIDYKYESEKLNYTIPSSKHKYLPDFKLPNGIYVEAKGIFDRDARKKMSLVIEQHPDKDIRILFMRNNSINKKSKTRYTDWCEERHIKCAVSAEGVVPQEWFLEPPKLTSTKEGKNNDS